MDDISTTRKAYWPEVVSGVAMTLVALWFWFHVNGDLLQDLRLLQAAEVAPGQIIDSWEDLEDGEEGQTHWFHAAVYTFRLPDGQELHGAARGTGRLREQFRNLGGPVPIEVEYDPADPSVNRLKGSGSQSVIEWVLRKLLLGGILLVVLVSPGLLLCRNGVKAYLDYRKGR